MKDTIKVKVEHKVKPIPKGTTVLEEQANGEFSSRIEPADLRLKYTQAAALWVPTAALAVWTDNPRDNDHAVPELMKVIKRFGFGSPIVALPNGEIIAGHTRLKAALELRMPEVPVRFMDLDRDEAHLMALADNRVGEIADWNDDLLGDVLLEMETKGVDIAGIGWDEGELADIMAKNDPLAMDGSEDEVPELQAEVHSKPGEVYELGPHRLICGDCTDPSVWGAVTGDKTADLVLTDPPYGLGQTDSTKNDYTTYDDTEDNLVKLADKWLPIARGRAPAVVFTPGVTGGWRYPQPDWVLCWFYGGGQLQSSWGFNSWQPALCYGKDPSLAHGKGCRPDAVDMNTPANAGDIDHPCPKPLKFWMWMVERLTFQRDALIVDPFGGSGTTLIAAAHLHRVARLIELDPRYCDVIRRRWTRWAHTHNQDPGSGALEDA